MTSYIVVVLGKTQAEVTPAFSVTSIVAPLLGVFAGGKFIDSRGGYRGGDQLALTLGWCTVFAVCAASAAISCAWFPKELAAAGSTDGAFWMCIGLIAVTLIFGGAVIPAATGCIVASVATDLRQVSSAFSMFCFQQFGYALSPLISSVIGSLATIDEPKQIAAYQLGTFNITQEEFLEGAMYKASLELGFQVVMLCGLLGVVLLFCAWRFAVRQAAHQSGLCCARNGDDARPELVPTPMQV